MEEGERVKYLAVCVLSLVTHVTAGSGPESAAPAAAPITSGPAMASLADGALAVLLGGALVAIQLRRGQKSLRMPRPLLP